MEKQPERLIMSKNISNERASKDLANERAHTAELAEGSGGFAQEKTQLEQEMQQLDAELAKTMEAAQKALTEVAQMTTRIDALKRTVENQEIPQEERKASEQELRTLLVDRLNKEQGRILLNDDARLLKAKSDGLHARFKNHFAQ